LTVPSDDDILVWLAMKKIIASMLFFLSAAFLITCEQNDLYTNTEDKALSLLGVNIDDPVIIPAPTAIYIYSAGPYNGNLGGRTIADSLCDIPIRPAGTITWHAFLSVSGTDQIRDLVPSPYQGLPVVDAGGANVISSSWTLMWDGSIDMSLSNAGVLGAGAEWWNGSNLDGTYNASNCDGGTGGWTTSGNPFSGEVGNSNAPIPLPANLWINWSLFTCDLAASLLCVAY
jgi:hypothetical protein